jgi:hypothetical protein
VSFLGCVCLGRRRKRIEDSLSAIDEKDLCALEIKILVYPGAETVYLAKNKATSLSAYQFYEFHTTQSGTNVHPGQTFNLDYSLAQILPLKKDKTILLQLALVGYGSWQTTNNSGPGVNPADPGHYKVNSLGGAGNVILPTRKVSVGFKYFKEFSNSSTVQGSSLQIYGAITF